MKQALFLIIAVFLLFSCQKKEEIDLLVSGAKIYTVNDDFEVAKAMAINNGKIIALAGDIEELKIRYKSKRIYEAKGKFILPGFIDAHAHFYGLGLQQKKVNLTGTNSFTEVVKRITKFQKENQVDFITGRGWDQNDWEKQNFPTKDTLDKLFPNTPIAITRIDGHALLANQKALDMANITKNSTIEGGEFYKKNGQLTGVLIDNAMSGIQNIIPEPNKKDKIEALKAAEEITLSYGLTTIVDAGLNKNTIQLIDSLQQAGKLKTRLYTMVSSNPEDLDYFLNQGIYKTERLHVGSVKAYADGALGSRGAALKKPYSDKHKHFGALLMSPQDFKKLATRVYKSEYQLNTHAIGDSANVLVLKTYDSLLSKNEDRRWRVEHAQIIDKPDFDYFGKNIIPSVQPTHATSDMYWAEKRIGKKRLKNAYAYKKLLEKAGLIALGTDFPIEKVSPFLTFYAAVARKDAKAWPENGFQPENALTREEALRGMTIWAAYGNFEEKEKGSLEVGKMADFIVLDHDIMKTPIENILTTKVEATFINGEKVFAN
ncbi:amidohydrolase [Haloflavibacter putidus]|uniref:Amidohydrolase n=1 Tax=Haloflavibacter putidus TaxID=2576776 RepID=A0A507ZP90_9FLAO|nr:amidohydrolase [Haloflavibacter putidus]TQD38807.1 amidohydrolase [Haloflavibacter putidus]